MEVFLILTLTLLAAAECSDILLSDCRSVRSSGVYHIQPDQEVYCDMKSEGGNWMVFHRRMDGSVNFYRPWDQYKNGFGDAFGEYWLGLQHIQKLTRLRDCELLVTMEDFEGNNVSARYSSFYVGPESDGYRLHVSGFTDGGAGDGLVNHNGMKFSTFDRDQDISASNCARARMGAFWYFDCAYANPNGVYVWGADATVSRVGVEWGPWKGTDYSLKSISMMLRPVQ